MATPQAQGFGNVGATPSFGDWTNQINQGFSSNPFAKALNTIQSGSTGPYKNPQTGVSFSPQGAVGAHDAPIPVGTNPGIIHPSGQAIKSQTKTNVDGSSQSVTYHPPAAQASYQGGQALPAVGTPEYAQAQKLANPTPTATGTTSNTGTAGGTSGSTGSGNTFTGATQGLINQGQGGAATGTATQGLINTQNQTNTGNAGRNQETANTNMGLLTGIAQNQTPVVTQSYQNLQNFNKQSPLLLADVANNPNVAAEVSVGRGAQLGQVLAGEQQGLANTYNAAVQGENQQIAAGNEAAGNALTGQGQQVTAGTNAGTLANTAQGNQITAQNYAGGLTQPSVAGYGQTVFNPATGTYSGGGGNLNPQTVANNLAADVIAGRKSYADAVSALGYAGNAGQTFLNQAIQTQKPGFNVANATGAYNANQTNTTTAGTASTQANANIYGTALTSVASITGQLNVVNKLGEQLIKTGSIAGVSPTDSTLANKTVNQVMAQFGQNANFVSTMAEFKEKVSGLLGIGGSTLPSQVATDMNDAVSGNLPFSKLPSLLNQISTNGNILLEQQQSVADTAYKNMTGGSASGNQSAPPSADMTALRTKYGY